MRIDYKGISHQLFTNEARCTPSGQISGQNGADSHLGTTSIPTIPQALHAPVRRKTKYNGGTQQLFSPAQSWWICQQFLYQYTRTDNQNKL